MLRKVADPRIPEELFTARLRLRRWRLSDLDALAGIFAQPEVWKFPFARGLTREETEARLRRYLDSWDHDGFGKYAVEREAGTLIGYVGLELVTWFAEIDGEVEIGWRLHPRDWGHGYATEAALTALQAGFDHLGCERIVAVVEPANAASLRLAERIGMVVVRETFEPRHGRVLRVFQVEREHFERPAAPKAVAGQLGPATGSRSPVRAR